MVVEKVDMAQREDFRLGTVDPSAAKEVKCAGVEDATDLRETIVGVYSAFVRALDAVVQDVTH